MDCERYRELISAALDGEPVAEEAAELHRHLADCPECRAARSEMERLRPLLAQCPTMTAPASFVAEVRARLKLEQREKRQAVVKYALAALIPLTVVLGLWLLPLRPLKPTTNVQTHNTLNLDLLVDKEFLGIEAGAFSGAIDVELPVISLDDEEGEIS